MLERAYVTEALLLENELAVDPLLGSGTAAVAAKRPARRFAGGDENIGLVNTAFARLARDIESEPSPCD
jgi:DNA modification methylase